MQIHFNDNMQFFNANKHKKKCFVLIKEVLVL